MNIHKKFVEVVVPHRAISPVKCQVVAVAL
jgi:hypothetical protein